LRGYVCGEVYDETPSVKINIYKNSVTSLSVMSCKPATGDEVDILFNADNSDFKLEGYKREEEYSLLLLLLA